MAAKFFRKRVIVLLALVVVAYVAGKGGIHFGFWDGPVGG